MKSNFLLKIVSLFTLTILLNCIEPYDISNISYENHMIVEGIITDEFKLHKIKLSNSIPLDQETNYNGITGATVRIKDSDQNVYNFIESSSGIYESEIKFKAQLNVKYELEIKTKEGKTYKSNQEEINGISKIENVFAKKFNDNINDESISITVNNNTNKNTAFYRYEYEETYKITPPYWSEFDLVPIPNTSPIRVEKKRKTAEEIKRTKFCYTTKYSKNIIVNSITNLNYNSNSDFNIRLISKNDPIISSRYSILVKQYTQSSSAYNYYKTLNKFAQNDNILSQNQPGYFYGNIKSISEPDEKVIGYFEICSIDKKRVFLNRYDFFTDATYIFFVDCATYAPSNEPTDEFPSPLVESIIKNKSKYYMDNPDTNRGNGPYLLVDVACGDCSELGSSVKPTFWID